LAGDLINEHGIRQLVVSGAPFRLNVIGTELKRKHGVQLTSDLRDPWTWHMEFGHSMLSPHQLQEEMAFERTVMEQSDHVITPCAHMHGHLTTFYPEYAEKILRLPHAIDPDELNVTPHPDRGECSRLIYAGTLYGAAEAGQYVKQLLLAFDRLKELDPQVYDRTSLDLYITGAEAEPHRAIVERSGHGSRIVFHAPLPAHEINQRIAESDAVLAFMPSYKKNFLGTKFNETFYQRRPMIHVGETGAVSEHILRHKLGTSIPLADLPAVLPGIITGGTPLELNTRYDVSDQLLDHITDRLVKEVFHI
jgi:glycosyltransferase involved in cell wall biosynthesis